MKRIRLFLTLPLLAAAFSSCNKTQEQGGQEVKPGKVSFTATIEDLEPSTGGESFWLPGDQILLVLNDGNTINATLVSGSGTAQASFVATVPGGKSAVYGVYPKGALNSAEGNTAKISIPDSQAGSSAPEKMAVGKVASGNKIAFKNVNAVLGLQLKGGTQVSKIEVSSVDGNSLAGIMSVDCSGSEPVAGSVSSPVSTVSTETFGAGTYYLTLAPGTHPQGLKVKTYTGQDAYTESGEYDCEITALAANTVYIYEIHEVIPTKERYVSVEGAGTMDGTSAANAMSAAKMWGLLSMVDGTLEELNGSVFNLAAGTYDWGESAELSYPEGANFRIVGVEGETIFTGNNEHRILKVDGEADVTVDGISFVGGQVTVAAEDGESGGALLISAGTWEIKNCSFSGNKATNGGAIEISGGAVTLTDCTFTGNEALNDSAERDKGTGYGGAVDCDGETASIHVSGCTFTGNAAWRGGALDVYTSTETIIENSIFTDNGSDNTRDAGAIYLKRSTTMTDCEFMGNKAKFGGAMRIIDHHISIDGGIFKENTASGNAGAISVGDKGRLVIGLEKPVTFQGNTAGLYGGALEVESLRESVGNDIHNSIFKDNQAQWGGAVALYGKSGKSTNMYFKDCIVEGNSATKDGGAFYVEDESLVDLTRINIRDNHAGNNGGAVCVHGWKTLQAFRSLFIGNYAASGGAVYAEKSGEEYADVFIDECSFDANYITKNYGCVFNINGVNRFCLNNSSIRGSYVSKSATGEKACWIDYDAIQVLTSISNCSIIGGDINSALVWSCEGSWKNYFTNNIITPDGDSMTAIHCADAQLDKSFNVDGKLSSAIGALAWAEAGYWQWNGTIDGAAPEMVTKTAAIERLTQICEDFVKWCGEDISKDQRNVERGEFWWPGAYQNN